MLQARIAQVKYKLNIDPFSRRSARCFAHKTDYIFLTFLFLCHFSKSIPESAREKKAHFFKFSCLSHMKTEN